MGHRKTLYVIPLASKAGQLMGAKASSGRMLALYLLKRLIDF
jgi:hypothetical protein